MTGESLEVELSQLCQSFVDLPDQYQHVPEDLFKAAERWKELQRLHMERAGVLADLDASSMERGAMIWLNMMMCQRKMWQDGYFYETENGPREHPAGPSFRAYSNQMEKWEGQHAAYPMARHNKSMNLENTGGPAAHGNKKAMDLIAGK